LPHAIKSVHCFEELLILLWKLLDENHHFLHYVLHRGDVLTLVVPLLYLAWEARPTEASQGRMGVVYSVVFVLLRLSSEREFAVALNVPVRGALPIALPPLKNPCYADLLVIVLHKVRYQSCSRARFIGVLTAHSRLARAPA
jgi:hypothetical protein